MQRKNKMKEIDTLVTKLETKAEVDAVFLTGSFGLSNTSTASDIDIVIILKENRVKIKSVYQIVDGAFADIFFFDHRDIRRILAAEKVDGNSMVGILVSWLLTAKILFDKSGLTTKASEHAHQVMFFIPEKERIDIIQKISYNLLQNRRYYDSEDDAYREALGIRLLYSVTELITGFLTLHNEPWRGEKYAIAFMKSRNVDFYNAFLVYQSAACLATKIEAYEKMASVIQHLHPLLDYRTPVSTSTHDSQSETANQLKKFWERLTS